MDNVVLSEPFVLSPFLREEEKLCSSGKPFLKSLSLSARETKLVCVTSGNSFLGSHVVKELVARGYLVRVTLQNPVDFEDMKRVIEDEELNKIHDVVIAKMQDLDGLCNAFRGCHAVFHTQSFIDPHGISGYSEQMAFLEAEAARNILEACGRTAYVRRCIFTSSLLASIWSNDSPDRIITETCWSDENFCREKKLWLALGKTTSEKIAWRKSKEMKVNLVTLCPGLLMDTSFPNAHKETSTSFLKGGSIMLQRGILATADVKKVAEAHAYVYEAMDNGASGRYFCYDRVIQSIDEAIKLENELKMEGMLSGSRRRSRELSEETEEITKKLTNSKLTNLLLQAFERKSCKKD